MKHYNTYVAVLVVVIFALLFLQGCEATVQEHDLNKVMHCTDFRDEETFSFNTSDITNAVNNWGNICFDVVDSEGVARTLCNTHELFIKCKIGEQLPEY